MTVIQSPKKPKFWESSLNTGQKHRK